MAVKDFIGLETEGGADVGANSQTIASGDLVANSGGFIIKAVDTSTDIVGIANGSVTTASDNQTVAQVKVGYTRKNETHRFTLPITGGTITGADEGKFYNLTSDGAAVDGTTEATSASTVTVTGDAQTVAVANMQLKLVKYISSTSGVFTYAVI